MSARVAVTRTWGWSRCIARWTSWSKHGVVRRMHRDDGCHGYALAQAAHGHHLICSSCNQVVEFAECGLDGLLKSVARRTGFRVEGHWLSVRAVSELQT